MRVLVSCANGSGTSLMMKRSVEKAMKAAGVPITNIHHCAISEGKSTAAQYDVVFCPLNFMNMFDGAKAKGVTIVGVKNVMSPKEIQERIETETDLVARASV
ncbi:PTS ascorbate transporter subunit IIB [Lactococcus hodotermopsidis]|uniref:PTS ascorbate transporter subunit IIB n=1 Tax=Pseudolactococcus hodotermopsidis TaxID=2709157 RepID=A0A6A0BAM5_9LACT|nr:PTS sugar transporter subunit IIB [Lactococcus hodotermopsidis]GFH42442.1 PTS ascorbate transporter subunit IIB [Lactococcus hodotermopsidis]